MSLRFAGEVGSVRKRKKVHTYIRADVCTHTYTRTHIHTYTTKTYTTSKTYRNYVHTQKVVVRTYYT